MALIIWGDEPREVPGLGLIAANQEISVKEKLAQQLIRQGFAKTTRRKSHGKRIKTGTRSVRGKTK